MWIHAKAQSTRSRCQPRQLLWVPREFFFTLHLYATKYFQDLTTRLNSVKHFYKNIWFSQFSVYRNLWLYYIAQKKTYYPYCLTKNFNSSLQCTLILTDPKITYKSPILLVKVLMPSRLSAHYPTIAQISRLFTNNRSSTLNKFNILDEINSNEITLNTEWANL